MADRIGLIAAGTRLKLGLTRDERLVAAVRRGDAGAFELLYERSARELSAFCLYMLGSRQDAEDALQATFTSAYRAMRADSRPIALRPWLFTIARNECLGILRRRRPSVELNGEVAHTGDPVRHAEVREEVGEMLAAIRALPESQRAALVLAEVHGLSHAEIGPVLGIRADQVKAHVYQARSNLISERHAREADCGTIREELAAARGADRLRGPLRRHLRACQSCRSYAQVADRQRRQLAGLMPVLPALTLKYRALEEALSLGSGDPPTYANVASTAAEAASGGVAAIAIKVVAGLATIGAGAGVGVSVLNTTSSPASHAATTAASAAYSSAAQASREVAASSSRVGAGSSQRRNGAGSSGGSAQSPSVGPQRGTRSVPLRRARREFPGVEPDGEAAPMKGTTEFERSSHEPRGGGGETQAAQRGEPAQHREEHAQVLAGRRAEREQRKQAREEHRGGQKEKAEEEPTGASEAPKSEEERQLVREARRRKHLERRRERESQGGEAPEG